MIRNPRLTIARVLGLVALVGLDCGLVRFSLNMGPGTLALTAFGLVLSIGGAGWLLSSGRSRRFSAAFAITTLVLFTIDMVAANAFGPETVADWQDHYLKRVTGQSVYSPASWELVVLSKNPNVVEIRYRLPVLLYHAIALIITLLIPGSIGGLVAMTVRWRRPGGSTPDPTLT
jgi:hypothetical protein